MKNLIIFLVFSFSVAWGNDLCPSFSYAQLNSELLSEYLEQIHDELGKGASYQNDNRTHRATREYGYSFFKMERGDFTYVPPPQFLQELGAHICRAFGDEVVAFTNIIISEYDTGFHLEPHVDVGFKNRYENCSFYFGDKIYGIVVEADSTGSLYFVRWDEDLHPPLELEPLYSLSEKDGMIFCFQDEIRSAPYFHGVSPVSNHRLSITFRTVIKTSIMGKS
jgi:hypothetical protein